MEGSYDWTRRAATVLAIGGLVLPVVVVFDLLTDTGCKHDTKPHVLQALVLMGLALVAAFAGVFARRYVAERTRAKLLTLLPAVVLGLSNAALAGWFYFAYAFHVCLSMGDIIPLGR